MRGIIQLSLVIQQIQKSFRSSSIGFKDARSNILSDSTPPAARQITDSQFCLLPYSKHEAKSVKFVLLCGSELFGLHMNHDLCKNYINELSATYDHARTYNERCNTITEVYEKHYQLQKGNGRDLHHVETEVALLKIRVENSEKDSIILVQLNGDTKRSFPPFLTKDNDILRTVLGSKPDGDGSKYECFLRCWRSLSVVRTINRSEKN